MRTECDSTRIDEMARKHILTSCSRTLIPRIKDGEKRKMEEGGKSCERPLRRRMALRILEIPN